LQFEVDPDERHAVVRQTTVFDPAGYVGLAYWYALYPVHHRVFSSMLRKIQSAAESRAHGHEAATGARTVASVVAA
jgi:hypothetical protein